MPFKLQRQDSIWSYKVYYSDKNSRAKYNTWPDCVNGDKAAAKYYILPQLWGGRIWQFLLKNKVTRPQRSWRPL